MQIRLFHLENSRSQRIVWLLEELGLSYELIINQHSSVDPNKNSPHSLSKFPTIEITAQDQTVILAETSAIIDYLSHYYPKFAGTGLTTSQLQHFYYWKNYAEATFIPDLLLKQIFAQIVQRTPFPVRFISKFLKYGFDQGYLNPSLQRQLHMIDDHLKTYQWFAGEQFTVADILMWFPLLACSQNHQQFKYIQLYLKRIESRPSFQTALVKGQWSASTFQSYWTKAW